MRCKSPNCWCVTGTPITSSGMAAQLHLLGHHDAQLTLGATWKYEPLADKFDDAKADKLKRIMIRHTKSQRIHGEVALALPDCDCRTVFLDMSADECIVVEDTDVGIAAGRAAGMRTVGVRGATGDLPVHSISELHRWLHASN